MTGLIASRCSPTPAAYPRRWLAAWCSYEWACSTYPAIILSFVFGPYFAKHVASDSVTGTVLWGRATAISAVAIALLSPVCGAFCDKGGRRKIWLLGCCARGQRAGLTVVAVLTALGTLLLLPVREPRR